MPQNGPASIAYCFGRFVLEPEHRSLRADGQAVGLSSRALDILLLLVAQRGRLVGKEEIMATVWQGLVVEENNLAVQISTLRRALGEGPGGRGFIATVPGRGYRFVGDVEEIAAPRSSVPSAQPLPPVAPATAASGTAGFRRIRLPLLVGVAACIVAGATGLARMSFWPGLQAPRLSIVVLPFRNLSGDAGQDYLADAITDDLTTDLSHLPGSTVIARGSADAYKNRAAKAQIVGRALRVRYLLEGSIAGDAGKRHVNAQLIDAASGSQLWASGFDVVGTRLADVQAEIVRHLASTLDFHLVQVESARSLHERPANPDAEDLFLRARSLLDRDDSLDAVIRAQALLEQAIAAEPEFADALAQLGLALLSKITAFDDPDEWRDHARAGAVIAKAISLAPQNPLAITARGRLSWVNQQCERALPDFRLALTLDPDEIRARDGLALCDLDLGQMAEMIETLQQVILIDPAAPNTAARQNRVGFGYLMLQQPAQALDWLQRARAVILDRQPLPPALSWQEWNTLYLIAALQQSGDHARAASLLDRYQRVSPHRTAWRLGSYDTRALAALPGHAAMEKAWRDAGMPGFADEHADYGVTPSRNARESGDFDPTPTSLEGAATIDTEGLTRLMAATSPPLVLDLGRGAAAPPGAVLVLQNDGAQDASAMLDQAAATAGKQAPIVVLSDSSFGWSSYNAALELVAAGYRHVLWYRGGEEAWAAAARPAQDRRPQ